jgi:hypothetical protein
MTYFAEQKWSNPQGQCIKQKELAPGHPIWWIHGSNVAYSYSIISRPVAYGQLIREERRRTSSSSLTGMAQPPPHEGMRAPFPSVLSRWSISSIRRERADFSFPLAAAARAIQRELRRSSSLASLRSGPVRPSTLHKSLALAWLPGPDQMLRLATGTCYSATARSTYTSSKPPRASTTTSN